MTGQTGSRRGWKIGVLTAAGALVVAGGIAVATLPTFAEHDPDSWIAGQVESEAPAPVRTDPEVSAPAVEEINLTTVPRDGAVEVNPAKAVSITAENGTVKSVSLMPDDGGGVVGGDDAGGGEPVPGGVNADGQVWTAAERLAFDTEYTLKFTVADGAGRESTHTRSFHTVVPANEADAWTYPLDGMTVGVGQPVQVNFSEPVLNKAEIEEAITISTSAGQTGDFHWYNDSMLRYRPENFWEPNSTITVDFQLFGVGFGNGMIGNHDSTVTVNVGESRRAVVDNTTKQMKAYIGGELVKTMPVTLGMDEWPSTSGVHVIMDQQRRADFNAGSIGLEPGDEHYYPPLTVDYASRISNGGEFVHSALQEALPYVGTTNVSHGCIGLFKEDAAWFFNTFTTGDVVEIHNTAGGELEPLDGFGDWNLSWEEWTQ